MKTLIMIMLLTACTGPRRVSKLDVGLYTTFALALAVDVHQTVKDDGIFDTCAEGNPVVGRCGQGRVPLAVYIPVSALIVAGIGYAIPRSEWRTGWLGFIAGFEVSVVAGNYQMGAGL